MAELKDKLVTLEDLKYVYDTLNTGYGFDENGNLNVPGSITVGDHKTPIGSAYVAEFEPTTAAKGNISNTWVSETGATLTLSEGVWIIVSHAYYSAFTTYSGSTGSSAGVRRVRTGYKHTSTGNSSYLTGSKNTSYTAGNTVCGVTAISIRTFTQETQVYPEVYSANQVGLTNVRIEAVRIA